MAEFLDSGLSGNIAWRAGLGGAPDDGTVLLGAEFAPAAARRAMPQDYAARDYQSVREDGGAAGVGRAGHGAGSGALARDALLFADAAQASDAAIVMWQPVRDAHTDIPAYFEAMPLGIDGKSLDSQSMAPENLGGCDARCQSHAIMQRAADELQRDTRVSLAVGICARCLHDHRTWSETTAVLRERSDIAARLIVQIDGEAALDEADSVRRLLDGWRACGCRIALDGLGVGYKDAACLAGFAPDIVTIAAMHTRALLLDGQRALQFTQLAQQARASGATIVARGVDDRRQIPAIHAAGVRLLQGHAVGGPSLVRPWRIGSASS